MLYVIVDKGGSHCNCFYRNLKTTKKRLRDLNTGAMILSDEARYAIACYLPDLILVHDDEEIQIVDIPGLPVVKRRQFWEWYSVEGNSDRVPVDAWG